MEDGWEDEWSFDDEEEEIEMEISEPTEKFSDGKSGIAKEVESCQEQRRELHENRSVRAVRKLESPSPSLHAAHTQEERGKSHVTPIRPIDDSVQVVRPGEPVLQVLQTYLMDQLQSYSLQFTTDQQMLRDECNRRFLSAFTTKSTLEELARYYSSPKQVNLFLYTLQKEVPRMDYRVIVEDFSRPRGKGGPWTKTLTNSTDIQSHFLLEKPGQHRDADVSPTVTTSSLEHLILRSANQSLLADALAMLTSPDGLVRPQYFTTTRATNVRFVVDTIRGSVNCQSTLEISIPSISTCSQQSKNDGQGNRVAIATIVLNMLYIPPYSPTEREFLNRPDLETREPRLECHILDICPAPLLKTSPEQFLRILKQAANSLANTWLEMGHTEPALEEMLGNVAKGHALLVKQSEQSHSTLLDFTTVHSLRESLLSNSTYSQANSALVQAASKGSTGFASAWQQLDSATGLGSKVKFLSNVSFLPSADVLALDDGKEDEDDGVGNRGGSGMFQRPPSWKVSAPKGLFPRPPSESVQTNNQRGLFPRPPMEGNQSDQRGKFPRPPAEGSQAAHVGMFPRPPVEDDQTVQRDMFPRPPMERNGIEQRGAFPRPPVEGNQMQQRGMFPRPEINDNEGGAIYGHNTSQTSLFPRPPESNVLFPRPPAERLRQSEDQQLNTEISKQAVGTQDAEAKSIQSSKIRDATPRGEFSGVGLTGQKVGMHQFSRALRSHHSMPVNSTSHPTNHAAAAPPSQNAPIIGGLLMSGLSRVARSIAPPAHSPSDISGPKLYNRTPSPNKRVASPSSERQLLTRKGITPLTESVLSDSDIDFDEDCKVAEDLLQTGSKEAKGRSSWDNKKNAADSDSDQDVLPPQFRKEVEVLAERLSRGETWRAIRDGKAPSTTSSCSSEWEMVPMPSFDEPVWRRLLDKEDILDDGVDSENHLPNTQETRKRWITSREFLGTT